MYTGAIPIYNIYMYTIFCGRINEMKLLKRPKIKSIFIFVN